MSIKSIHSLLSLVVFFLLVACSGAGSGLQTTAAPTAASTAVPSTPASLAAPTPTSGRGQGDTLRLIYWQAPTIINSHLSAGTKDLSASRITYEPLASFDNDGNMVPFLAAEIPTLDNGGVAADGKSVTWKLKPDVKWSDGKPFTADDVLFTYEYIINPDVKSTSSTAYTAIESVEVVDDYTVKINFKEVTPAWFQSFVGSQGTILPRHVFADYNGANAADAPANLAPVGTGPYRVVEYKKEDVLIIGGSAVNTIKIIYEPNPYFREPDNPYFSRVELQGGGDANVAAQAIRDGLADFAWNLVVEESILSQIDSGGHGVAQFPPGAFVERIMINFTDPNRETTDGERSSIQFPHPFLSDKRVRQAIAYAIDRKAIADSYSRGGVFTPNILVAPTIYDSPNTAYEYDPEKAAALLDEAGWLDSDGDDIRDKDGIKLKVVFQTSILPLRQLAQEVVKKGLGVIGFEVELKNIDSSIFLGPPKDTTDTRRQFYTDLEEYAFSNKSPDPGAYMAGWACDQAAQKSNDWSLPNWARYCNPAYDELYKQSLTEIDPEKRQQLFIQMNDLLIEDAAVIPLVQLNQPIGVNNSLIGLKATPWDAEVWNIKDWRRK